MISNQSIKRAKSFLLKLSFCLLIVLSLATMPFSGLTAAVLADGGLGISISYPGITV